MKHTQELTIRVNGKTIKATVQLEAPGLSPDDCLSARMILAAAANGQKTEYRSRHHKDRVAIVEQNNPTATTKAQNHLQLVA
ncbi:hypothetical protein [Paraburkholderia sp. A3RO-2L]|uniref:hypothetical protein n=1 Tax=unclassified Paraburkholderia TaxID=2615204 RepID=UPI003DA82152